MHGLRELVDSARMREIDRATIRAGTPGVVLMERAGQAVFAALVQQFGHVRGRAVVVVCGPGNNGGDGFVVARLLAAAGAHLRVFLAASRDRVRGDAATCALALETAGVPIASLMSGELAQLSAAVLGADVIVDALLGTGLADAPRGVAAEALSLLSRTPGNVLAVDIPSGVVADSGAVPGPCVRATLTVTFGLPKIGQLFYPGRAYCGDLRVVDIGLTAAAVSEVGKICLVGTEAVAQWIPRRPADAHKGTCGTAVVVAGSVGMTGAAALAADATLCSGAGKAVLGIPESLNDILEAKLTEVMTYPLPEIRRRRCLALRGLGEIRRLLTRVDADVVAIGPGLGRHRDTVELVRRLVVSIEQPLVIDADALYALAGVQELLRQRPATTVLTPHGGEFRRLAQIDDQELRRRPLSHARAFATDLGVTLVLKGAPTIVAGADGSVRVIPTGNAGLATAGTGDVLTGLILGLLAQGAPAVEAAAAGAYIHGLAGDRVRDELGEWGVKAGYLGRAASMAMAQIVSTQRDMTEMEGVILTAPKGFCNL